MNIEQARENMLKQQLRTCHVLNQDILDLLQTTPREQFVPEAYKNLAFVDMHIPLGMQQVMMTPLEEGRMLQALAITPDDHVLEIGTGSGYVTALLARQAKSVVSVDIHPEFTQAASQHLQAQQIKNVELLTGDAANGWQQGGPFDVICITGSLPALPASFKKSLHLGGRLFAIIGTSPAMQAVVVRHQGDAGLQEEKLFETDLPPLMNAMVTESFEF